MWVVQIIRKQWDKGQHDNQHAFQTRLPIDKQTAIFAFDKRCIIDFQGDNRMNRSVIDAKPEGDWIQIDHFLINLKTNHITPVVDSQLKFESYDSWVIKEKSLSFRYQWRYKVFEGGYYYWLYEYVVFNIAYDEAFEPLMFMKADPDVILLNPI